MKIVIDIPEDLYSRMKDKGVESPDKDAKLFEYAIRLGCPLSEYKLHEREVETDWSGAQGNTYERDKERMKRRYDWI